MNNTITINDVTFEVAPCTSLNWKATFENRKPGDKNGAWHEIYFLTQRCVQKMTKNGQNIPLQFEGSKITDTCYRDVVLRELDVNDLVRLFQKCFQAQMKFQFNLTYKVV